jgi:methionine-rich copper-binding protein CopC
MTFFPTANQRRAFSIAMLLVATTVGATIALGHSLPVAQTVKNNATYASVVGPIEIYWPYRSDGTYGGINVSSANVLLKPAGTDGADCTQSPLPASVITCGTGIDVAAIPVTCPVATYTDACARISLPLSRALEAGSYELVYQVAHLDGFIERTIVKFTVDPSYVPPPPSPSPSPRPSASPRPSPSPSAIGSPSPSPSAPIGLSPSPAHASPTATTVPSNGSPSATAALSPESSASGSAQPSASPLPGGSVAPSVLQHDPFTLTGSQWAALAVALPIIAVAAATSARRKSRE